MGLAPGLKNSIGLLILFSLIGLILGFPFLGLSTNRDVTHPSIKLEGDGAIVFFGFSQCPGICPLTLARLSDISPENLGKDVSVVYVEILDLGNNAKADVYAKKFSQDFIGLAPNKQELDELAGLYKLNFQADTGTVQHQGRLYLVKNTHGKNILFKEYDALKFNTDQIKSDILKMGG